ncbi:MAG: CbtA family protein [Devosia nanyangense]|uniref:CbtA family protein n=1 Tax=Devosia nanyangense TaxID=1228055 RepID=A0A933NX37_9HYPH|nr:CbtA family protein [Devosia nanyangense]
MKLFQRLFFAAVLSGLTAGAVMAGLQQWRVAPLILQAEVFEQAEAAAPKHEAAAPTEAHDEDGWAPQDGAERIGYTVAADLLTAVGFAFVLAAASVLSGIEVTARNGVVWGLAGYLAFQLAPAFGLPPELPGMPAAELVSRQVWWWGSALATATAIFGIAKFRNGPALAIGAVLLVLPHVIGAPPQPEEASSVPAHLATSFAASTLAVGAAFWLALGPLYGWLSERLARTPATTKAMA